MVLLRSRKLLICKSRHGALLVYDLAVVVPKLGSGSPEDAGRHLDREIAEGRTDADGLAYAGSQLQVSLYVNDARADLNRAIVDALPELTNAEIAWVSPLRDERYAEYRDSAALERLGLNGVRHRSLSRSKLCLMCDFLRAGQLEQGLDCRPVAGRRGDAEVFAGELRPQFRASDRLRVPAVDLSTGHDDLL